MKILVFGATGQLGRELARTEWLAGSERLFLDRAGADMVGNPALFTDRLLRLAPDVVVNAAAYTAVDLAESNVREAFAVNATAPGHIAAACSKLGAIMIHISTDYVFDGAKSSAYVESDPIAPLGVYGRSKAEGEAAVRSAGARHIILRTAWVYSSFGKNFVKTMLRLAGAKAEVSVVDDQIGSPTSAAELAQAIACLAARVHDSEATDNTYHLAGTGEATWYEIAEAIFEDLGRRGLPRPRCVPIPTSAYPTAAKRPANSRLNSAKFLGRFGWTLPQWRPSLARVLDELHAESVLDGSSLP